ncbi:MAG: 2-C-methyl-D-erythritol 2,4-cyclodiphosphate synthase [Propionibacteriaceae bacterium]|nr:2-C-methyl-D-erythritol 2,4-cyclodiphosphate synthase [Propionibacteriaceae bacterium]
MKLRTGVGVDAHQLVQSRPMVMAGVSFPDEKVGPKGHSDGDVACHAVCDALLSAAGLGDLGQVFGTDDPAFAGASGVTLLAQVVLQVRQAGWQISNVAVQVIGNRPAMAPRRREAEELLSAVVGAPVSVSATSTDGMGFTGRSEGVMAVASALLMSW